MRLWVCLRKAYAEGSLCPACSCLSASWQSKPGRQLMCTPDPVPALRCSQPAEVGRDANDLQLAAKSSAFLTEATQNSICIMQCKLLWSHCLLIGSRKTNSLSVCPHSASHDTCVQHDRRGHSGYMSEIGYTLDISRTCEYAEGRRTTPRRVW